MSSLIAQMINYISETRYQHLPDSAIASAKTFIYDTIGVGLSGSRVDKVYLLKKALIASGDFNNLANTSSAKASIWLTGEQVSVATAAMVNGYQIHNQEWDCVHEGAVVHPMATILSALTAYAEDKNLSGEQLILGVVVAVDIATLIGESVSNPLAFFRPSICGCIGATAGICAMMSANRSEIANALGIAYSQISGTMQAHVEGSPMLAMQIAVNSRAAITAANLAFAGFDGPKDILEGQFGYFNLFETDYCRDVIPSKLGKEYQITKVSHKPFPTGRAGHGVVDALACLQAEYGFSVDDIKAIKISATPLINRLVARPVKSDMDASYAKLCNGYIAATYLLTHNVLVEDFDESALRCPERLALASKITTELNDCQDPNALAPLTVFITLSTGQHLQQHLPAVLGHPERPMTTKQQDEKFIAACKSALRPLPEPQIQQLQRQLKSLEQLPTIAELVTLMLNKAS
ncbi:MmgE/PrpD family protein [Colwellia sp. MEBiC06753]